MRLLYAGVFVVKTPAKDQGTNNIVDIKLTVYAKDIGTENMRGASAQQPTIEKTLFVAVHDNSEIVEPPTECIIKKSRPISHSKF